MVIIEEHLHRSVLLLPKLGVRFEAALWPSVDMHRTEDQPDLACLCCPNEAVGGWYADIVLANPT